MAVIFTKHPPATIECVTAFSKWYGMPVCENMDIQTEVAWTLAVGIARAIEAAHGIGIKKENGNE